MTDSLAAEPMTDSEPTKDDGRRERFPEHLRLYTLEEVAAICGISTNTAYRMRKAQAWPHLKFGGQMRFSVEDIEAIQALNRQDVSPAVKKWRNPNIGTDASRRRAHNHNIRHGLKKP